MSLPLDPALVLAKPLMAHLATASPDGGPRHSPVWFLWEDDAIWLVSSRGESLAARLRAEPRCAIGIVDFDCGKGILRHVGMRGAAAACMRSTSPAATACSPNISAPMPRAGAPTSRLPPSTPSTCWSNSCPTAPSFPASSPISPNIRRCITARREQAMAVRQ